MADLTLNFLKLLSPMIEGDPARDLPLSYLLPRYSEQRALFP